MYRRSLPMSGAAVPAALAALAAVGWHAASIPQRQCGPLAHEAYVWQRDWTGAVSAAAIAAGREGRFARLVVLTAEAAFPRGASRPQVVRVRPDYAALRRCGAPVGLAIRVGPYAGTFAPDAPATEALADLTDSVVRGAAREGLGASEVQIDFDCAESRLDGYALWLRAVRRRIAPTPLTFTALPCWLDRPAFARLAASADGFVLQVHSLHRPRAGRAVLCDPHEARRAVERAAAFARPFRVALPTYGYLVAFDRAGRLLGLSAEGPAPRWPVEARVELAEADAGEMAAMVRCWTADRPAHMRGIIWYRLPVEGDRLNWPAATLSAVTAGSAPRAALAARARRAAPGLVEIVLANVGQADARGQVRVSVAWGGEAVLAADALGGFRLAGGDAGTLRLAGRVGPGAWPLPPGRQCPVAWIRFARDTEVQTHVQIAPIP